MQRSNAVNQRLNKYMLTICISTSITIENLKYVCISINTAIKINKNKSQLNEHKFRVHENKFTNNLLIIKFPSIYRYRHNFTPSDNKYKIILHKIAIYGPGPISCRIRINVTII